jgi:hypothetical protein
MEHGRRQHHRNCAQKNPESRQFHVLPEVVSAHSVYSTVENLLYYYHRLGKVVDDAV